MITNAPMMVIEKIAGNARNPFPVLSGSDGEVELLLSLGRSMI